MSDKNSEQSDDNILDRENLFDKIEEWSSRDHKNRFYFRGEQEFGQPLLPSLIRPTIYQRLKKRHQGIRTAIKLEELLLKRFMRYTSHIYHADSDFQGRNFEDIEMLCLSQHNGLPTLLLDWTFNPFVAIYFALRSDYYQEPQGSDSALWVMKLKDKEGRKDQTIHLEDDKEVWSSRLANKKHHPLVVVPLVFTRRIAAQSGRFIYAAHLRNSKTPLNDKGACNEEDLPWDELLSFKIPKTEGPEILKQLTILGFHEGRLFPDLKGWAKYLRDGNL